MRWYEYSAFYGLAIVCLRCVLQAGDCGPVVCSWAGGDVNAVCSMDILRAGSFASYIKLSYIKGCMQRGRGGALGSPPPPQNSIIIYI